MQVSSFSIRDISAYRSELMGWSILWIMMLHFNFVQIKPLGFLAQYGFAGVEIFLLVSGFGLYCSLDKENNIGRFYRKRLLRIFPTYYFLGIFSSIILYNDSIVDYIFRYTTIGYWTGGVYGEWYIPALISLYAAAPFFKWLFDRRLFWLLVFICAVCLVAAYFFVDKEPLLHRVHFFLLYRIPAFIFGMTCAYWMKKEFSVCYFYALLIAGIPFFVYLFPHHHVFYNYKYYSLFFLLPLFIICFVTLAKFLKQLRPILAVMGKASLEIYLIQGMFFYAIISGIVSVPETWHDTITIGLIIVSTLLGILTHWLIDKSGILRQL